MTLLTLSHQICDESGMSRPNYIIGNNDLTAKRLLAAANSAGRELSEGRIRNAAGSIDGIHDWSYLRKEKTFTTSNGDYDYKLDSTGIITDGDFSRICKDTVWDRTNNRRVEFVSAMEWQQYVSGLVTVAIAKVATIRGGYLLLHTTPTSTDTFAFEYISTKWCQSAAGAAQTSWTADTDTGILPENLLLLGAKWRFKEMMGLPYAEDKLDYLESVQTAMGHDLPSGILSVYQSDNPFMGNIPETGYGA